MKTSSQDVLITKNSLYTNDNQQENDITSVTAETADNNIKNINDPNYLSPFEKPQLEIQMDNFATIYSADKNIAISEGIDFFAYDAAYHSYLAYMTPLVADMTTYSPIVRSTFNSMVTAVQAEQKRFNAATQAQYSQQINKAQTDISDGQTKYKALQSEAKIMESSVAGISDAADRAISSAGFASNAASAASQAASSALASAMSAESNASSAVSTANSTASAFGPVSQKADSAFSNAMSAESAASSAVSQALSAAANSKDAKQIAGAVSQSYKTLTDGSTMTIAELEGGLAVKLTKTDLNGYATQDWSNNQIKMTADGISGSLSSVKSTVDSHTTSINTLQTDSNGFKDQFTKVNNTVSKHTTDIGTLQADSKSLSSNFDSLNTANGTNEHDISELKQTSKEVSSTLETVQTQVQDSAVGTNLLTGTGDHTVKGSGSAANGLLSNETADSLLTLFKGLEGQTVTVSVDYEYSGFVAGPVGAFTNRLGWEIKFFVSGNSLFEGPWYYPNNDSDSGRISSTFVVPKNLTSITEGLGYIEFPGAGTATLSHLKLEKGSLATDWSANPADNATVTAVSSILQTVDGMTTDISKKIEQKDLNGYATQDWAQNQINISADGINGAISSVKNTVDSQTTSIHDLQTDSNGFKDQFTKVNNTISQHTTDIGTLQHDAQSLSSNFDSLNTDNGTNQHNIGELQQSAKDFNSTLETVKNSGGGRNLIANSANDIIADDTINKQGWCNKNVYENLIAGQQYTFTSDVTVNTGNVSQIRVRTINEGKNSDGPETIVDIVNGHISWTFTAAQDKPILLVYAGVDSKTYGNKVTFHHYQLETGIVAHDWSPAPEDLATVTALTQVKQTADSAQVLATNNHGDITSLQETAKGLQSTVSDKVSSDQLTQLSSQLTNEIKDLSSSTSSQFTQTGKDINGMVKKGDVVNQFNLDAGGALLSTSGNSTKIVFSSPNIIFDSNNPVQIPNANIPGTLTGKTIEAAKIIGITKITGADIEAPIIHSPNGSFRLDGKTGDIIGASIHSADNSWRIDKDGNINGATINAPVLNLGDNGQLTASYSVNDPTGYFQPISGTGSLHMDHGYIQSTANIIYYNKILNGIGGNKWGHWESSTQFVPAPDQAHPDTSNIAESTLTPAFLKLDIFNADRSSVNSRAYIDGTGLYINDGQSESITSMLSDYELLSSGMAYLNSGIQMKRNATFTFGNLAMNGYHSISMLDGRAINFTDNLAGTGSSPIEVKAKTFTKSSRLSIKHDITPLSTAESSRLLNAIDVEKFRYTHDSATYKYQYGGVIDDVNSLGSKQYSMPSELLSEDGTGINLDSLTGVLIKRVQDQDKMIGKLSMRLTKLEMEK